MIWLNFLPWSFFSFIPSVWSTYQSHRVYIISFFLWGRSLNQTRCGYLQILTFHMQCLLLPIRIIANTVLTQSCDPLLSTGAKLGRCGPHQMFFWGVWFWAKTMNAVPIEDHTTLETAILPSYSTTSWQMCSPLPPLWVRLARGDPHQLDWRKSWGARGGVRRGGIEHQTLKAELPEMVWVFERHLGAA